MNSFSYLVPTIYNAPDGYDVTVAIPAEQIADRLADRTGNVAWDIRVFHDGKVVEERHSVLQFAADKPLEAPQLIYCWRGTTFEGSGHPAFIENSFNVLNEQSHFTTKTPVGSYALYSAPGRPSYRADPDYKFGSPPIIQTVSSLGRLIDGYPVIRLDRERGYGESLATINPYGRPIIASVRTHDGRKLPPQRVPPQSALMISLEPLLKPHESRWTGRIQLTANNRVLLAHVRHRFGNPKDITDHEHLDPYRADATHMPASQWLRQAIGDVANRRFGIRW